MVQSEAAAVSVVSYPVYSITLVAHMTAQWLDYGLCSLQKKCDWLEVKISQYAEKFTQCDADRQDIMSYLQMLLMQKGLLCIYRSSSFKDFDTHEWERQYHRYRLCSALKLEFCNYTQTTTETLIKVYFYTVVTKIEIFFYFKVFVREKLNY